MPHSKSLASETGHRVPQKIAFHSLISITQTQITHPWEWEHCTDHEQLHKQPQTRGSTDDKIINHYQMQTFGEKACLQQKQHGSYKGGPPMSTLFVRFWLPQIALGLLIAWFSNWDWMWGFLKWWKEKITKHHTDTLRAKDLASVQN